MSASLKVLLAAAFCVAASTSSRAQSREDRHGGGAPRTRAVQAVRPRAPQPMRVSPNTRLRPSGEYKPPVVRYDIKPAAPIKNFAVVTRPGAAVFHAPAHHAVVGLAGFAAGVFSHETVETLVNHPYWHTENNVRYAHTYDGNIHWYGFYNGPRFYWTRYEDNRWWWFDQAANRWLYWYDNYWWWHNPANPGVPYVVINDNYYPYSDIEANPQLAPGVTSAPGPEPASPSAAPVVAPQTAAAMAALDKTGHGNRTYVSPDSSREVQIYGDRHEAFLYDRTGGGEPRFIAFLASGARRAQFSESSNDHLQVLLLMHDGSYDVFDADGHSLLQPAAGDGASATSAAGTDAAPPALPSAPPIPAQ